MMHNGNTLKVPALSIRALGISYENHKNGEITEAVGNVSLDIAPGEFVTIVGLSGCGKSTLLSAVAGLVPFQKGAIAVDGKGIKGAGRDRSVVFQKPSLLPWRTVIDNITYGLELQHVSRKEARKRAERFVKLVQLENFEHFHPQALSGGMQQRVNLARALVTDPKILLLDEPFAALDAITRESMQNELLSIWEVTQKTVLMVTHQIDEAVLLSDRVIVFSERPAHVVAEIAVDIPRPRKPDVKKDELFLYFVNKIWSHINKTAEKKEAEFAI